MEAGVGEQRRTAPKEGAGLHTQPESLLRAKPGSPCSAGLQQLPFPPLPSSPRPPQKRMDSAPKLGSNESTPSRVWNGPSSVSTLGDLKIAKLFSVQSPPPMEPQLREDSGESLLKRPNQQLIRKLPPPPRQDTPGFQQGQGPELPVRKGTLLSHTMGMKSNSTVLRVI